MGKRAMPTKRLILPAEKLRLLRSCYACPYNRWIDTLGESYCRFKSGSGKFIPHNMRTRFPSWCPLPDVEEDT